MDWNIQRQKVVLRRVGGSHSTPRDAAVATSRLVECLRVVSELDSGGMVNCRGFGEIGDEPEYDAIITTDPPYQPAHRASDAALVIQSAAQNGAN